MGLRIAYMLLRFFDIEVCGQFFRIDHNSDFTKILSNISNFTKIRVFQILKCLVPKHKTA